MQAQVRVTKIKRRQNYPIAPQSHQQVRKTRRKQIKSPKLSSSLLKMVRKSTLFPTHLHQKQLAHQLFSPLASRYGPILSVRSNWISKRASICHLGSDNLLHLRLVTRSQWRVLKMELRWLKSLKQRRPWLLIRRIRSFRLRSRHLRSWRALESRTRPLAASTMASWQLS